MVWQIKDDDDDDGNDDDSDGNNDDDDDPTPEWCSVSKIGSLQR